MSAAMPDENATNCAATAEAASGCVELYAGNERAHRHVELPGLQGDVMALPAEGREGGDLYALFSCGANRYARIVLAKVVGPGYKASVAAKHVHALLHEHSDIGNTSALLAALHEVFEPAGEAPGAPLRLTSVVSATYYRDTGEFTYAYAAHPRMLLWREKDARWRALGEQAERAPLGTIADETYGQQTVQLEPGDMLMAVSEALSDVLSPEGTRLTAEGLMHFAGLAMSRVPHPASLHMLAEEFLDAVERYHGATTFEDDLTVQILRRTS